MVYNGIRFIVENDINLNIIFTSTGDAFHVSGSDPVFIYSVKTIVGLSLKTALFYYYSISHIDDIEFLGLEAMFDASQ